MKENKINYLRNIKTNLLLKMYVDHLISNLFIEIDDQKKGYAKEMIKYSDLLDWCWQSTTSIIPFFKKDDTLVRGTIVNLEGEEINHSWINFSFNNKIYVFDPCLGILVPKEKYYQTLSANEVITIDAESIKEEMLNTLINGKKDTTDETSRIIPSTDNIKAPFYHTNMSIKGETIGKKILTLRAQFNH